MRRIGLTVVAASCLASFCVLCPGILGQPEADRVGAEVEGIRVSLKLETVRIAEGELLTLDLQIKHPIRPQDGKRYETYIPWVLSRPSTLYEIRAVNEQGEDRIIFGGHGKDAHMEVLHLPPGHFCGYSLQFVPKGFRASRNLEAGEYKLYAVFRNAQAKIPGPAYSLTTSQVEQLTGEQRNRLARNLSSELKRVETENDKLGNGTLWMGEAFSQMITLEVVPR